MDSSQLSAEEARELDRLLALSAVRRRHQYQSMAQLSARMGNVEGEREALLVQYETLRQESMNSTNNRVQVLILGSAAMAALVGGALTIDNPSQSKGLIYGLFSIAIPLMWIFVLLVWLSEATRAHRVGAFLAGDVEARINRNLGKLVMTWEAALWTAAMPRDERGGPSMIALLVLGLVAGGSPVFGLFLAEEAWQFRWWLALQLAVPYGMLGLAALYVISLMPRLRNTGIVLSVWPGED